MLGFHNIKGLETQQIPFQEFIEQLAFSKYVKRMAPGLFSHPWDLRGGMETIKLYAIIHLLFVTPGNQTLVNIMSIEPFTKIIKFIVLGSGFELQGVAQLLLKMHNQRIAFSPLGYQGCFSELICAMSSLSILCSGLLNLRDWTKLYEKICN